MRCYMPSDHFAISDICCRFALSRSVPEEIYRRGAPAAALVAPRHPPILRRFPLRAPRGLSMNSAAIDVVGIGNAIVDVIAHADESFLAKQGFAKGSMTLIDADR